MEKNAPYHFTRHLMPVLTLLGLLAVSFGFVQYEASLVQLSLFEVSLKESNSYQVRSFATSGLEQSSLPFSLDNFPDELLDVTYYPDETLKEDVFSCEKRLKTLWKDFKVYARANDIPRNYETFADFWKNDSDFRDCFALYSQSSPELIFKFNNLSAGKYLLNKVRIFVYSSQVPKAFDKSFHDNFTDQVEGREKFVFDPTKLLTPQEVTFRKTYVISQDVFSINLKLHSNRYWSGKFQRYRHLFDLTFVFQDEEGQTLEIRSDPMFVSI